MNILLEYSKMEWISKWISKTSRNEDLAFKTIFKIRMYIHLNIYLNIQRDLNWLEYLFKYSFEYLLSFLMALNILNSGYSSHSWIFIWIFKIGRSPDDSLSKSPTARALWRSSRPSSLPLVQCSPSVIQSTMLSNAAVTACAVRIPTPLLPAHVHLRLWVLCSSFRVFPLLAPCAPQLVPDHPPQCQFVRPSIHRAGSPHSTPTPSQYIKASN